MLPAIITCIPNHFHPIKFLKTKSVNSEIIIVLVVIISDIALFLKDLCATFI